MTALTIDPLRTVRHIADVLVAVCVSTTLAFAAPQPADPASWMKRPYDYVIVSQSVRAVLQAFGTNTGVHVAIASDVSGFVHGNIPSTDAVSFLDNVTRQTALDWYFDGALLYVSPVWDERSAVVPLHDHSVGAVKSMLKERRLFDERYGFHPDGVGGVLVSGPPSYVSILADAISSMSNNPGAIEQPRPLTIYRGGSKFSVSF